MNAPSARFAAVVASLAVGVPLGRAAARPIARKPPALGAAAAA